MYLYWWKTMFYMLHYNTHCCLCEILENTVYLMECLHEATMISWYTDKVMRTLSHTKASTMEISCVCGLLPMWSAQCYRLWIIGTIAHALNFSLHPTHSLNCRHAHTHVPLSSLMLPRAVIVTHTRACARSHARWDVRMIVQMAY